MSRNKGDLNILTSDDEARISKDEEVTALADRFRDLLKDAGALSGAATLMGAEIAAEVDAMRDGRLAQMHGKSRCTP